jgi:hypothetical protein
MVLVPISYVPIFTGPKRNCHSPLWVNALLTTLVTKWLNKPKISADM